MKQVNLDRFALQVQLDTTRSTVAHAKKCIEKGRRFEDFVAMLADVADGIEEDLKEET